MPEGRYDRDEKQFIQGGTADAIKVTMYYKNIRFINQCVCDLSVFPGSWRLLTVAWGSWSQRDENLFVMALVITERLPIVCTEDNGKHSLSLDSCCAFFKFY